jgi:hypothetical protein
MLASLLLAFTLSSGESPALPALSVGPVHAVGDGTAITLRDVDLTPCVVRPIAPLPPSSRVVPEITGQIVFQITVRRRRADVIAVSALDRAYAGLTPCIERQIATLRWPVRSGRFEVPIVIGPSPSTP